MSAKGAMIELQVNPTRIPQLPPLHSQTPLQAPLVVTRAEGEFTAVGAEAEQRLES